MEYRYGKRGSKLKSAFKNKVPTDFATVNAIFERERDKQLSEGYTTGEAGTPYVGTEKAGKMAGVHPQLVNAIEEDEIEKYLNDDSWVMQEKKDGVRCMFQKRGKETNGVNKKGVVTSLPSTTDHALRNACGVMDATLDGELIGEVYWLFDLLSIGVHAYAERTYRDRLDGMQDWFNDTFGPYFQIVPTAVGKACKQALYKKLKEDNAEGVVFSKLDSTYKAGRPHSGGTRIKFKFKGSATVRVRCINKQQSFQMEMMEYGNWIYVGDCTYFPTVFTPTPGQFLEIEYLYVNGKGGCLFQPVIKEQGDGTFERKDVDSSDCETSQLKYKQGSVDVN